MDMLEKTKILNQISIAEVARYLGVTVPKQGSTTCPLPDHEDSNPSFSIFADGSRWKCYGCDRGGGAIDLVKEFQGVSFIDAKRWLAEASGFARGMAVPKRHKQPKKTENVRKDLEQEKCDPEPKILRDVYETFSFVQQGQAVHGVTRVFRRPDHQKWRSGVSSPF